MRISAYYLVMVALRTSRGERERDNAYADGPVMEHAQLEFCNGTFSSLRFPHILG